MKVSEFLRNDNIPTFLLGAFYGRYEFTKDNKFIYTYSSYRNWAIYDNESLCAESKNTFINQANELSRPYEFWEKGTKVYPRADIVFSLENDLELTKDNFFNRLNRKILNEPFLDELEFTSEKKMFLRGFSELRGSFDRNRRLLTMDYVKNSRQETKRVRLLIDNLNVPVYVVNYNFREFQPEFESGKERETQLRFNIFWYATNVGFINDYRKAAFKENFDYTSIVQDGLITYYICCQPLKSDNTTFENRLAYYAHNVFGKDLKKNEIAEYKKSIGIRYDKKDAEVFRRDLSIVNYVRYYTPDACVCCCDDYPIETRTHKEAKTNRYHFEIHHMISVGHNKELDDVDNLAKICPACHASLGRGSASEEVQKIHIKKIFAHKPNILKFCESYFDEDDFDTVINLVWQSLK